MAIGANDTADFTIPFRAEAAGRTLFAVEVTSLEDLDDVTCSDLLELEATPAGDAFVRFDTRPEPTAMRVP